MPPPTLPLLAKAPATLPAKPGETCGSALDMDPLTVEQGAGAVDDDREAIAKRRQFGPAGELETAILDYQTHQRRLMPRLARTFAFDFGLQYLKERYLHKTDDDAQEQIDALITGGVDVVLIETIFDTLNAKAALWKSWQHSTSAVRMQKYWVSRSGSRKMVRKPCESGSIQRHASLATTVWS